MSSESATGFPITINHPINKAEMQTDLAANDCNRVYGVTEYMESGLAFCLGYTTYP